MIFSYLLSALIGYLIGSVSFALVIGKVFYKTDIRTAGSKNLGGGNAGRVLGSKAGLAVMALDILKVTFAIFLASLLRGSELNLIIAGIFSAIGHCFPLFARFKGGKAVATLYGFLFGMMVVGGYSPLFFLLGLCIFLIILYCSKIIAAASIGSAIAVTIMAFFMHYICAFSVSLVFFMLLIIWRHRSNLQRIIQHKENKISWM